MILEISYRRRRAVYNEKKEIFKDIQITAVEENLPPPGYLWQIIISRIMLALSGLFWTFLILGFYAGPGEQAAPVLEALLGGVIINFVPVFIAVKLEISYRQKKKIYNELRKSGQYREISPENLRLSPPGQLWRAVLSRVLLIGSGLFWLLFIYEVLNKSDRVVSKIFGNVLVPMFISIILIISGVMLEISYRSQKRTFLFGRKEDPAVPPAHDPGIPAKSDEEITEYSEKLKGDRDQDRFYYKKRE